LVIPGDCTLTDAPLGNPATDIVTLPVVPVRVSVAVMLAVDCEGKTRGAVFDNDTARLPLWAPPPWPPAEPPQPVNIEKEKDSSKKPEIFQVMSQVILNQRQRKSL
jgi:hypothetical protein